MLNLFKNLIIYRNEASKISNQLEEIKNKFKEDSFNGHWLSGHDIKWLISQVETLTEIQQAMGLSHADCFNEHEAIEEIKRILEFY